MNYRVYRKAKRKSYYVRFELGGKETVRTLRTLDWATAKKAAAVIYDAAHAAHYAPKPTAPPAVTYITVGELCSVYEASYQILGIESLTAHRNAKMLVRILTLDADEAATKARSIEICTKKAVQEHQKRAFGKGRDAGSINSDISQARSVFSARAKGLYENLSIALPPSVEQFGKATMLKTRGVKGFKGITPTVLEALDKGMTELVEENFEMWKTTALVRSVALRNDEVLHMRGDWFKIENDRVILQIRNYPERVVVHRGKAILLPVFIPKTGHERDIEIGRDFFDVLKPEFEWQHIVMHDGLPTPRYDLIYRDTSKWVRKFLPDRVKSLYELRKQAGSEAASIGGLEAAQQLLGHKLVSTTKAYYHAYLNPAKSLAINIPNS